MLNLLVTHGAKNNNVSILPIEIFQLQTLLCSKMFTSYFTCYIVKMGFLLIKNFIQKLGIAVLYINYLELNT